MHAAKQIIRAPFGGFYSRLRGGSVFSLRLRGQRYCFAELNLSLLARLMEDVVTPSYITEAGVGVIVRNVLE